MVSRKMIGIGILLAYFALGWTVPAFAQTTGGPTRAKPPKFPKSVVDLFSTDAKESLSGERPDFQKGGAPSGNVAAGGTPSDGSGSESGSLPNLGGGAWSKMISSDTLEGEIKFYKILLGDDAKTPGAFKAGGVKKVRKFFSEYAALFAIISEYDGDVKWKNNAVAAREIFGRCASNCKAATDAQFQEAKRATEDLETMIGGGSINGPAGADPKNAWPKVADRRILMQRMEDLHQVDITAWTANENDFKKNADKIVREAELMTALCEISIKPGYEYADDKEFMGLARILQKACMDEVEAAKSKNYDAARKAVSIGTATCAKCHSGYRS